MSTPVKFSIITVTYNASRWLERTILSILEQNYPQMEYIIIDGGSTDGTVDIIKQYAPGITYWVSEPDKGIYDAMNKGLHRATGDYVWFLNAGDVLPNANTLQRIGIQVGRRTWPDILYGETSIVNEKGRVLGLRRLRPPKKLDWKSFRMGMRVCHQSFIPRREIAPDYDLSYKLSSDFDWCIRCMKRAGSILNTGMILSHYLDAGISTRMRKESLKERYAIMCKYYGTFGTWMRHVWFAIRFFYAKWVKGMI